MEDGRNYIYTILMYEDFTSNVMETISGGHFLAGWFGNEDDAKSAVMNNAAGINEKYYDYALIEKVGCGVYCRAEERWLYKYNRKMDMYDEIDLPESISALTYPFSIAFS